MKISSQFKLVALATLVLSVLPVSAQTAVNSVSISKIRTGWNADNFALETKATPVVNPANCPVTDGYMSIGTSAGYKTFLTASLTAFSSEKKVTIVVSDTECVSSRPKIWGIYLEQ